MGNRLRWLKGFLVAPLIGTALLGAISGQPAPQMRLGYYSPVTQSFGWPTRAQWPAPVGIAPTYYAWGESFQAGFARLALAHGAEQLAELATWQCQCGPVSLADVTDGSQDAYLRAFARAVAAFGHPVAVTFDHEMNGCCWYPWQVPPAQAAVYTAAWRHVWEVMTPIAPNIVWVWAPNEQQNQAPAAPYWPGSRYVAAAGVDCYLGVTDTFSGFCGPTVAAIRSRWHGPVWITETGLAPGANRPGRISAALQAARSDHIGAWVYFDKGQFWLHRSGRLAVAQVG